MHLKLRDGGCDTALRGDGIGGMMIGMEKQEAGTEIRSTATSSNTNLT
jgi:hypothetical protein